jgi:hypothetical protein
MTLQQKVQEPQVLGVGGESDIRAFYADSTASAVALPPQASVDDAPLLFPPRGQQDQFREETS